MMFGIQPQSYSSVKAVTTSDTAVNAYEAFMAIGAGNLVFKDQAGNSITLIALPIYTIMPFKTSQIMATGTTSTGIFGLR